MSITWDQALSIAGAFIILSGFALQNFGPENSYRKTYLLLNLIGSAALTVTAVVNHQLGFIILEGIWALISAYSLLKAMGSGK